MSREQSTDHDDRSLSGRRTGVLDEHNCWRRARAERLAWLVDGAAYFAAFRQAVREARRSILVVGWDIDGNTRLVRDDEEHDLPIRLGAFLNTVVSSRDGLQAHVLVWDFAMIYALEREWLPVFRMQWRTHRRLHFRMDDRHPVGASHHQKIVVVDDRVAFIGGLDLTRCRWDTPEHLAHDPRRVDVGTEIYPPFHDLQAMVEGEAAAVLGDLVRERWRRATGETLERPTGMEGSPWPATVAADLEGVEVAIARTEPAFDGQPAVREAERLHLDAIASAHRSIYVENQYLTAACIGDALTARLREETGPEVILVLPCQTGGWLERATMDVLRARLTRQLREADRHGRLRFYYPDAPGLGEECIHVHSKVLVVDRSLVLVGSANLSNRSMGLDTECVLALAANGEARIEQAIGRFRDALLAEHLGVERQAVTEALAGKDSLIAAVEQLQGGERTLRTLEDQVHETLDRVVPDATLVDPERPLDAAALTERFMREEEPEETALRGRPWLKGAVAVGVLLGLAATWRWSPLSQWLDAERLAAWVQGLQGSPLGPLVAVGGFVVGGLVAFPVTVLVVVTALVLGPVKGFVCALVGAVLAAGVNFAIGHHLGRDTVRRLAGSRLNDLSRRLASRGVLTIMALRNVPVAPFSVVNVVAGASHIRFRDFLLGTVLGMAPGMLGLTVFADTVLEAVVDPKASNIAMVAVVVVVLVVAGMGLRRWLARRAEPERAS